MGCSLPGPSLHGILQARIMELPFPYPGDLPDSGIEPRSPALQADPLNQKLQMNYPWNEYESQLFGLTIIAIVVQSLSPIWLFHNPMDWSPPGSSVHGISQTKIWSGLPFPSPGDLPDPGIEPTSDALAGGFFTSKPPEKPLVWPKPLSYTWKCNILDWVSTYWSLSLSYPKIPIICLYILMLPSWCLKPL